jgi:hypothetical protein
MTTSLLKSALVAVVGFALSASVALHAQTNAVNPIATSPVQNPTTQSTDSSATSTKVVKTAYTGTLKSNDGSSVTVTTDKGDLKLTIDPTTKIAANHKKAALTDLTVGEKVTGSYVKNDDGTLTAASIRGHSAK